MSIIVTSNHTRVKDWVKNCRGEISYYSSILYIYTASIIHYYITLVITCIQYNYK